MSRFRTHLTVKLICFVLISAFVTLDIAWACPADQISSTHTLAAPDAFQPAMNGAQTHPVVPPILAKSDFAGSVLVLAKSVFEDRLDVGYVDAILTLELDGRLGGFDLVHMDFIDGVISALYIARGKKYAVQIARKNDREALKKLIDIGYDLPVSKIYAVNVVPEDYPGTDTREPGQSDRPGPGAIINRAIVIRNLVDNFFNGNDEVRAAVVKTFSRLDITIAEIRARLGSPTADRLSESLCGMFRNAEFSELARIESIIIRMGVEEKFVVEGWNQALMRDDWRVRKYAVTKLRQLNVPSARLSGAWRSVLTEDKYGAAAKKAALFGLAQLGLEDALDDIRALRKTRDPAVREHAAYALGRIGTDRALQSLFNMLADEDFRVVRRAEQILIKNRAPRRLLVRGWTAAIVAGKNDAARRYAIRALERCGVTRHQMAAQWAQDLARADNPDARRAALWVIKELDNTAAIAPLCNMLGGIDLEFVKELEGLLLHLGASFGVMTEAWNQALKSDNAKVRRYAFNALIRLGVSRDTLFECWKYALTRENNAVKKAALYGLGELREARVSEVIKPFTNNPDAGVRLRALGALKKISRAMVKKEKSIQAALQPQSVRPEPMDGERQEPIAPAHDVRSLIARFIGFITLAFLASSSAFGQAARDLVAQSSGGVISEIRTQIIAYPQLAIGLVLLVGGALLWKTKLYLLPFSRTRYWAAKLNATHSEPRAKTLIRKLAQTGYTAQALRAVLSDKDVAKGIIVRRIMEHGYKVDWKKDVWGDINRLTRQGAGIVSAGGSFDVVIKDGHFIIADFGGSDVETEGKAEYTKGGRGSPGAPGGFISAIAVISGLTAAMLASGAASADTFYSSIGTLLAHPSFTMVFSLGLMITGIFTMIEWFVFGVKGTEHNLFRDAIPQRSAEMTLLALAISFMYDMITGHSVYAFAIMSPIFIVYIAAASISTFLLTAFIGQWTGKRLNKTFTGRPDHAAKVEGVSAPAMGSEPTPAALLPGYVRGTITTAGGESVMPITAEVSTQYKNLMKERVKELFRTIMSSVSNRRAALVEEALKLPGTEGMNRYATAAELKDRITKAVDTAEAIKDGEIPADTASAINMVRKNLSQLDADSIIASFIILARRAERQKRNLVIALETDWVSNTDDRDSSQSNVINLMTIKIENIVSKLRHMGLNNVVVVHEPGDRLAGAIMKANGLDNPIFSNIVVLASESTIEDNDFDTFRSAPDNNRPFLAMVDPSGLKDDLANIEDPLIYQLDIDIMVYLSLSLELAVGKEPPKNFPLIVEGSYDRIKRMVKLCPHAERIKIDDMPAVNKARRQTLESA